MPDQSGAGTKRRRPAASSSVPAAGGGGATSARGQPSSGHAQSAPTHGSGTQGLGRSSAVVSRRASAAGGRSPGAAAASQQAAARSALAAGTVPAAQTAAAACAACRAAQAGMAGVTCTVSGKAGEQAPAASHTRNAAVPRPAAPAGACTRTRGPSTSRAPRVSARGVTISTRWVSWASGSSTATSCQALVAPAGTRSEPLAATGGSLTGWRVTLSVAGAQAPASSHRRRVTRAVPVASRRGVSCTRGVRPPSTAAATPAPSATTATWNGPGESGSTTGRGNHAGA